MEYKLITFLNEDMGLFFIGTYSDKFSSGFKNYVTKNSLLNRARYAYENAGNEARDHSLTTGFYLSLLVNPDSWKVTSEDLFDNEKDARDYRALLTEELTDAGFELIGRQVGFFKRLGLEGSQWSSKPPSGLDAITDMITKIEEVTGLEIPGSVKKQVKLNLVGARSEITEIFKTRAAVVRFLVDNAV